MGLVVLRQGDGYAQGDEPELPGLQRHILGGVEVNPVGLTRHVAQGIDAVHKVFYLDLFHMKLQI